MAVNANWKIDYCKYLKEELNLIKAEFEIFDDIKIDVVPERSFYLPDDENTLLFIVKELTGNYVLNIKTQPLQIICWSETNTFSVAKQIFDYFVFQHKNRSFTLNNNLVKENYDTVVALRPMIEAEAGFKASFYTYGNFVECTNLADIQNLTYNNQSVNYISAGLTYGAVLNTTKEVGTELSTSVKQEAALTLSITMMNEAGGLSKDINDVMNGVVSGNTAFAFTYTINGQTVTQNFILSDATFTTNRTDAPGLKVTFTR